MDSDLWYAFDGSQPWSFFDQLSLLSEKDQIHFGVIHRLANQ